MYTKKEKILIIGAGFVGAAMTYHLSKQNKNVTLIESNVGAASEATEKSFAWINPAGRVFGNSRPLYDAVLDEYHALEKELPDLNVNWHGALTWGVPANVVESQVHRLNRDQIIELEPGLKEYPKEAIFAHKEGALDPVFATNLFIKKAEENGATVLFGSKVIQVIKEGSRVVGVQTYDRFIEADVIVLAAGTAVPELCRPLGIDVPVAPSPCILIRMNSKEKLIHTLISNQQFEARQPTSDTLLAAEDYIDESEENGPEAVGKRAFETLRHSLKGGENLTLESIRVGMRPMPEDGYPIVGFHDQIQGLYLAVMHAAIALAPFVSRLAAKEIVENVQMDDLNSWRLSRFSV